MSRNIQAALFLACALPPTSAWAQLADNSAVRQAEDGFGSSVGNEEIGIYNVGSARGFEATIVAKPVNGLNLVAGMMRQWPELSGNDVVAGMVGKRPVAYPECQFNGYQITCVPGLSLNANFWATGAQAARPGQSLIVPAHNRLDLGFRYRFTLGGAEWVANATVGNIFDTYGWNVGGDGGFTYSSPRTFGLSLYGDF